MDYGGPDGTDSAALNGIWEGTDDMPTVAGDYPEGGNGSDRISANNIEDDDPNEDQAWIPDTIWVRQWRRGAFPVSGDVGEMPEMTTSRHIHGIMPFSGQRRREVDVRAASRIVTL